MSVSSFARAQVLRLLPRTRISRAVGKLCESKLSPPVAELVARAYCRAYQVDMADALSDELPYPSFDAFFTRKLRDGARAISDDAVVSPADGTLSATGRIGSRSALLVKDQYYEVAELIDDDVEAKRYENGSFAVVYLAPCDYHRVHSPVDGAISQVRGIPGDYFPVNALGERYVPRLFVRNNRASLAIETRDMGRVTVVFVGAYIVGRITMNVIPEPAVPPGLRPISPPVEVRRGAEIGVFHLGSTLVLLFEPEISIGRSPGKVRYGESLLRPS
ncbi:MAG TPA: archaetidylserine decarboxylase [Polyangiaceae bacterium]